MENKRTWNYRLINKDGYFGIHSVHYDNGEPVLVSVEPYELVGDSKEDVEADMKLMKMAFDKPTLDYQYFVDREKKIANGELNDST